MRTGWIRIVVIVGYLLISGFSGASCINRLLPVVADTDLGLESSGFGVDLCKVLGELIGYRAYPSSVRERDSKGDGH